MKRSLMQDDEFQALQSYLQEAYERGDVTGHTGGCKKICWTRPGTGKRGGVRVSYYVKLASERIYLILIYPKNVKDELNEAEKAILKTRSQLRE
ncbi:type II toxin-antitoxin system RelE/ParE family toxin [Yokenella regensburgei]|uniref:type II toxin-antitoxin system RelE/ParE family toxin n=1 Tax=Yokenella regensburgei TaxID=158877 RepID=UPI003F139697